MNKTSRYIGKRITENFNFSVWRNAALIDIRREENGLSESLFDILKPFSHTEGKIFFSCNSLGEWHELCLHVPLKCKNQLRLPRHVGWWLCKQSSAMSCRSYFCIHCNGLKLQDLPVWLVPYWLISTSICCSIHFRIILCFSRLTSSSFILKLKCNENWASVIFNYQKITTSYSQLNDNYIHLCRFFQMMLKIVKWPATDVFCQWDELVVYRAWEMV